MDTIKTKGRYIRKAQKMHKALIAAFKSEWEKSAAKALDDSFNGKFKEVNK